LERTLIATLAVVAALLSPLLPVGGPVPPPICANPDVLDRVYQRLWLREAYAVLDRQQVSEEPTGSGDLVRCEVCVKVYAYDAPRAGMTPLLGCEQHGYFVQTVRGGLILLSVK
jgi:hypothetical protein